MAKLGVIAVMMVLVTAGVPGVIAMEPSDSRDPLAALDESVCENLGFSEDLEKLCEDVIEKPACQKLRLGSFSRQDIQILKPTTDRPFAVVSVPLRIGDGLETPAVPGERFNALAVFGAGPGAEGAC